MGKRSLQVDEYIASAAPFAQPILKKLRTLFHRACPQIEETLKWGKPTFTYHGIVGGMAAFKQHVGWGLWKGKLLKAPAGAIGSKASSIMSGGKPTDLSQLPPDDVLIDLIRQAAALNEAGVKIPKLKR